MALLLFNKQRRMVTFNLDSPALKQLRGKKVVMRVREHLVDGGYAIRRIEKLIPDSITLCAGEKRRCFSDGKEYPNELLEVPIIKQAIADGWLKATNIEKSKKAAKTKAEAKAEKAAAESKAKTDKKK